jgi:hypothetical protein
MRKTRKRRRRRRRRRRRSVPWLLNFVEITVVVGLILVVLHGMKALLRSINLRKKDQVVAVDDLPVTVVVVVRAGVVEAEEVQELLRELIIEKCLKMGLLLKNDLNKIPLLLFLLSICTRLGEHKQPTRRRRWQRWRKPRLQRQFARGNV